MMFSRRVTHDEARKAAQRLINSHFDNSGEKAVTRIPTQPDDDDVMICDYIDQQRARDPVHSD
jgi:hypothetical protein